MPYDPRSDRRPVAGIAFCLLYLCIMYIKFFIFLCNLHLDLYGNMPYNINRKFEGRYNHEH